MIDGGINVIIARGIHSGSEKINDGSEYPKIKEKNKTPNKSLSVGIYFKTNTRTKTMTPEEYRNAVGPLIGQILAIQDQYTASQKITDSERYGFNTIDDPLSFVFFKMQMCAMWEAEEVKYNKDRDDMREFEKKDPAAAKFLKQLLAFFAVGDGLILQNIAMRFLLECVSVSQQRFYISQLLIEMVHSESYDLMIDSVIPDPKERDSIRRTIEVSPALKAKADWIKTYIYGDQPFIVRVVAFAIVERVFFSTAFAGIFWFRTQNVFEKVCEANEFIARDEGIHGDFGCYLAKSGQYGRPSVEMVHAMLLEAGELECNHINEILPEGSLDLTPGKMRQYMKLASNSMLAKMDMPPLYQGDDVCCPWEWMKMISMDIHTNFHEKPPTQYSRYNLDEVLARHGLARDGSRLAEKQQSQSQEQQAAAALLPSGPENIEDVDF
jgi:ribonucleoside-diphosphate reductase subunit M2